MASQSPLKKNGSSSHLEPGAGGNGTILEGPAASWEVAYVYAFLLKFTELRSLSSTSSLLFSPMTLEEALLASSPSALAPSSPVSSLSSLESDEEDDDEPVPGPSTLKKGSKSDIVPVEDLIAVTPPSSPLLVEIILNFQESLPEIIDSHSRVRKDWFGWLFRFVKNRFLEVNKGGLQWQSHLMKRAGVKAGAEHEREFWLLSWEQKIHLLRVLVDYQLTYSVRVRDLIDFHYDLGKQRVIKRDPLINPLVLDPIGTISRRTIWHLDNSPRLYISRNPYKLDSPFHAVTSTVAEFQHYYERFTKPLEEKVEAIAPEIVKSKEVAGKGQPVLDADGKVKEPPKKRKKPEVKSDLSEHILNEMAIRKKLELRFVDVLKGEELLLNLEGKKQRALERASLRGTRGARELHQLDYSYGTSSRPSRLRANKQIDYGYDSRKDDAEEEEEEEYEEEVDVNGQESTNSGSEDGEQRNGGGKRRKLGKKESEEPPVWRGERRSNRLQLRDSEEPEEVSLDDDVKTQESNDMKMEVDQGDSVTGITSGEVPTLDVAPGVPVSKEVELTSQGGAVPVVEDVLGSKVVIEGSVPILA